MKPVKIFDVDKDIQYKVYITRHFPAGEDVKKDDGLCFAPWLDEPTIYVDSALKNERMVEVLIHEIAHAFFWNASEKRIEKFAKVASEILAEQNLLKGVKP